MTIDDRQDCEQRDRRQQDDDRQERVLDLVGLNCPLPVIKTRHALARLAPGERLVVLASDPLAAIDLPHLCAEDGHALIALSHVTVSHADARIRVEIERGPGPGAERTGDD